MITWTKRATLAALIPLGLALAAPAGEPPTPQSTAEGDTLVGRPVDLAPRDYGADWTQFRGPGGTGISDETGLPITWSDNQGVVWKTPLPGAGASSPITLGDKIFLTAYSGYGQDMKQPGNQEDLRHHLLCLDRASGKILWNKVSKALLPEQPYRGWVATHGYSSATPVTDGKAVYAFFGRSGVRAYRLDGEPLWHASVGEKTHGWGSGASPILHGGLLVVNASCESNALVALNKADGKEVWRVNGINSSWSTPAVATLADGKQELGVPVRGRTLGIDPATGVQLWQCKSMKDGSCPSVLACDGVFYVTGERPGRTLAIRAGGRGDVTDSHLLWDVPGSPTVSTPLIHKGLMYWVNDQGVAVCRKVGTGEVVYENRLTFTGRADRPTFANDKVLASLVLADGRLYCLGLKGGTRVLALGPAFKLLAANELADPSLFNATPVPGKGQLLVRSDKFLYCIGK